MSSILYIEDDRELARAIKKRLKDQYVIDLAYTFRGGMRKLEENEYDLAIIDYYLKDGLGADVCRKARNHQIYTPILFLSKNSLKQDIVEMLDSGADDFLVKPFDFDELHARIKALIRRFQPKQVTNILQVGGLILDQNVQKVRYKEFEIRLKRQEMLLLEYLMLNKNQVISRSRLFEHAWKQGYASSNTVDVHVCKLRKKLEDTFGVNHIKSIYGLGYMIEG